MKFNLIINNLKKSKIKAALELQEQLFDISNILNNRTCINKFSGFIIARVFIKVFDKFLS